MESFWTQRPKAHTNFFGGFSTNWRYELEVRVRPAPKHSTMAAGAEGISSRILARTRRPVARIEAKSMTH